MILFKQSQVYAPSYLGKQDVLIAGTRVIAIAPHIEPASGVDTEVIQANDLRMIPGLIDGHVHIAGAGGEGGPASRTPEMQLHHMLEAGVTTVIGCLGTDGLTRSLASVLMKVKALKQEGVSAWMLTGSYQIPTPTLLGDVGKDIAMIQEVIGVGEIAISDHRSSVPPIHELVRLAGHARVGGMLGGKCGKVVVHMGDAENPFRPLYEAVAISELKLTQFLPTHCNRNSYIFEDAKKFGLEGYIDLTASSYPYFPEFEIKPSRAVKELVEAGVPKGHITISSDGFGSLPHFDAKGNLIRLQMGYPRSIFTEMKDMVLIENMPLEQALLPVTSNVADILWLNDKGRISPGKDADLVLLDQDFKIVHLAAMGSMMIKDGIPLKKGSYEN